ncbi:MAG: phosphoglycerate dehydrogenase [Spirochaetia bacterium]|jgi:phosphoglycerate dehydrogenase-like enzyme
MAKILVTPRSLTKGGDPSLDLLKKAGHQLVFCTPGKAPDEQELLGLVPGCAGWLAGVEKITDAVLARADCLKAISRNGTGVDSIDLAACERRGISVLRAEGANARGVAELTIALMLSLLRSVSFGDARMKAGGWERRQGTELEGRTLGVVGTGRIGKLVTRFALGMDMRVRGFDAFPDARYAPSPDFRYVTFDELLGSSDIVTLHCPHTPGEKPLIDGSALGRMKKGAALVNTARGGLVDGAALLAALQDGRLAGYGVDAYEKEPPDPTPLLVHDRVIATPHVGAFTAESVSRATRVAVENLLGALSGAH